MTSEKEFSYINSNANEELYALSDQYNLDEYLDRTMSEKGELAPLDNLIRGHTRPDRKRLKTEDLKPIVFVNFNTRLGKAKPVILRALLDSGGSGSLVTEKFTRKLRLSTVSSDTVWTTPAGALNTSTKCKATFTIPELHDAVRIEWNLYVTKDLGAYDMIIGRDMMSDLGIDIKFSSNSVIWNGAEVPMKDRDAMFEESFHVGDTTAMEEATERIRTILEAKYEAANLREICNKSLHLDTAKQEQLFRLLNSYEVLFNGQWGHWLGDEYGIDLKEDAKPYHAKAFPIP